MKDDETFALVLDSEHALLIELILRSFAVLMEVTMRWRKNRPEQAFRQINIVC
jgi:hypothetical protein